MNARSDSHLAQSDSQLACGPMDFDRLDSITPRYDITEGDPAGRHFNCTSSAVPVYSTSLYAVRVTRGVVVAPAVIIDSCTVRWDMHGRGRARGVLVSGPRTDATISEYKTPKVQ